MRKAWLIIPLLFSNSVGADFFRCIGENGNKIFTDDRRKCVQENNVRLLSQYSSGYENKKFYNDIPDLRQTLKSANFAGGGKYFCGPVAISNSLVWLKGEKSQQYQIDLVHKLASPDYMDTNPSSGTHTQGLMRGVVRYVQEEFGSYSKLEYRGWHNPPKRYRTTLKVPTLAFMHSGLHERGAVWLNVGWYTYDENNDEYMRIGGHWVTLVGYENEQLVIHDPGTGSRNSLSHEFVKFTLLSDGTLRSKRSNRSTSAKGYMELNEGMLKPSSASNAIVDGVIVLQI